MKIGDVVILKSGSTMMTINAIIEGNLVEVVYHNGVEFFKDALNIDTLSVIILK